MAEPKLPAFKSDASFNYRLPWDVLNSFSLDGVSAEEEVGNRPCLKGSQEKSGPVRWPHMQLEDRSCGPGGGGAERPGRAPWLSRLCVTFLLRTCPSRTLEGSTQTLDSCCLLRLCLGEVSASRQVHSNSEQSQFGL